MNPPKAVVVGAGPAGLSAAIGLTRAGYQTRLTEQRQRWGGRVCGCFLGPEAARHLQWLGVFDEVQRVAVAVESTTVTWGHFQAQVSIGKPFGGGLALPRQALEEILWKRVEHEGVRIERGLHVSAEDSLHVLAGGRFSVVDKTTGRDQAWYGWNTTFSGVKQAPGEMSMHFYPGGYVGVVTFADGVSNICGLTLKPDLHNGWSGVFENAVNRSPFLETQVRLAKPMDDWRGVGPLPFSSVMHDAGHTVLVGDAAAVGDPFMGEGNSRALASGPMLYGAIQKPGMFSDRVYQRNWRRSYGLRLRMGAAIRWVLERPQLAHLAVPFLMDRSSLVRRFSPLFHHGYFL